MPQATASTTFMQDEVPRRRGLKPGQPNPGGFKKGDDPRRPQGLVLSNGESFAKRARELGPDALEWWDTVWRDESHPISTRLRASEMIVERGFGKAVSTLDINVNDNRPINTYTTQELEAMMSRFAGDQPRIEEDVLDAEFTSVSTIGGET